MAPKRAGEGVKTPVRRRVTFARFVQLRSTSLPVVQNEIFVNLPTLRSSVRRRLSDPIKAQHRTSIWAASVVRDSSQCHDGQFSLT